MRLYWLADWDGDGARFGLEHALGTAALRSDISNGRNLTPPVIDGLGRRQITFGVNAAALARPVRTIPRSACPAHGSPSPRTFPTAASLHSDCEPTIAR